MNWLRNNTNFRYDNGLTIKDDIEDELQNNPNLTLYQIIFNICLKESSYAGQDRNNGN